VVISDNRYGCWNRKVKSIFITHQLMVKSPFAENILHRMISSYISKFDECWIPDHPGPNNLSGDLSHKFKVPSNAFYVGPLSRLKPKDTGSFKFKILAIISGPEPQRSIFERLISEQLFNSGLKCMMVFGLPEEIQKAEHKGNILMINHLNSEEMQDAIASSEIIIARSGYSTIMDLSVMNKKAIFIPTPGQTEQEYLARYLFQKKISCFQKQSEFDLDSALKESEKFNGFSSIEDNEGLLDARIKAILS
jgi:predicted glycosyltransferase